MLRLGKQTKRDLSKIIEETERWGKNKSKLYPCCDNSNINQIVSRSKKFIKKHPNTGLIVVDFIQRVEDGGIYRGDKRQETNLISMGLANLSKYTGVPTIALSQLSRAAGNRTNKAPVDSDLKESGNLEQDAHLIFFIHRGYKYGEEGKDETDADIIVSKARDADTGIVPVKFEGQYARFFDIDINHEDENEVF
jgi:replicative DNA helicase